MSSTGRFVIFSFWPTLVAIALGSTVYGAVHVGRHTAMFDNQLGEPERWVALGYFGISLFAIVLLYVIHLLLRRRRGEPVSLDVARRLNPLLSFVLSGPFLTALTEPSIERNHPWRTWLYISIVVASWFPTLKALGERLPTSKKRTHARWSPLALDIVSVLVVGTLWAAYAYFFSGLSLNAHYALATRTVDLGLYDNIFYQSSHGNPLGCSFLRGGTHLSAHFDPILIILSPLHRLWPGAEFLLVLQAVWCGAGVVPAFLLGRSQLGSRMAGIAWAVVYALHPALHGANLYEFHSLTLLIPPLLLGLYFLLSGRMLGYYLALPLILMVREDAALLMCFVGLFGLISGDRKCVRAGWITILTSLAYFIVVKVAVMPAPGIFNQGDPGAYGFGFYYRGMIPNNRGELDFLSTLLTNPAFVVALTTLSPKLQYLLVIFFPLLFLPLWGGKARVMLLYGLIFILLASRSAVYSPHFQYSAVLFPVALALGPLGLHNLRDKRTNPGAFSFAMMGCVLIASSLTSWKQGAIVDNAVFRGGFRPIVRTLTEAQTVRYAKMQDLLSVIHPDASVSASNAAGAHVSSRADAYHIKQRIDTDYVLVDSRDLKGGVRRAFQEREGELALVGRVEPWRLYRQVEQRKGPEGARDPDSKPDAVGNE